MGARTPIEWAANRDGTPGATWNPIRGCTKISAGCKNCYAIRMASRFSDEGAPFHGFAIRTSHGPEWTGCVELIPEMLDLPLRRRRPTTYFVNSMSDLFHESLPDEAIDQVFAVMALCPQHRFICLTKRAERMANWASRTYLAGDVQGQANFIRACQRLPYPIVQQVRTRPELKHWPVAEMADVTDTDLWPLPNVILGVSCEDQTAADERIPWLLRTPAACRMISAEPLLGPLDLTQIEFRLATWYNALEDHDGFGLLGAEHQKLSWIITGGESGPGARPMHPDWARSLRDQCATAAVPFFFKQWGEFRWGGRGHGGGADVDPRPIRCGKRLAGRRLDGREWNERPEVLNV